MNTDAAADPLPSWNAGTREQILNFVRAVVDGRDAVPFDERVAVFDNERSSS